MVPAVLLDSAAGITGIIGTLGALMARQAMYQQIADELRGQIESGELPQGSQLPTELELGDKHKASRNTIRDAIKQLIALSLVETRPGQGTFVKVRVDPFVTILTADPKSGFGGGEGATYLSQVSAGRRKPRQTLPRVEIKALDPSDPVLLRLGLDPSAQVVLRHQERYIDEVPWSLQTSFYPMSFATEGGATRLLVAQDIGGDEREPDPGRPIPADQVTGAVAYLAEHGHKQFGYQDWITARAPDDNEQRFFGVGPEIMMFEIFRTAFDQDKLPMRVTVTVFPADRNQFIVNVGDDLPGPQYGSPGPA
jgi:GntR family transcriptional regulator